MPQRFAASEAQLVGKSEDMALFAQLARDITAALPAVTDDEDIEKTRAAQTRVLLRDVIAQANSRAMARHDHFDDADELLRESE